MPSGGRAVKYPPRRALMPGRNRLTHSTVKSSLFLLGVR
jgi:hypothetical protein